jgi:PKD repeat protein
MDIAMSGTVEGLNSGVAAYEVKNSSVTTSKIALQTAASATATTVCEAESTATPGTPPGEGETPGEIVAAFTGTPTSGTAPLTVTFTDQTGGAISWVWSFGDGTTSTLQNPVHTYTAPGTYPVSLAVSDGSHYDSEPKAGYIRVHAADGTAPGTPGTARTFRLATPQIAQAYDGAGVINATVTIRIDEGS